MRLRLYERIPTIRFSRRNCFNASPCYRDDTVPLLEDERIAFRLCPTHISWIIPEEGESFRGFGRD